MKTKSVDGTGPACTNTKTQYAVAKKDKEQEMKRIKKMRRI